MDANDVRRRWEERSGEYSPEYYAYRGPDQTSEMLRRSLERFVERDAPVLELGCSAGRHLSHLHGHGFDDLAGIEVNDDAFDVMATTYPDLRAAGEFYPDAIEDVVGDFDDDQFGAVYSVETLQHLHPDAEWVFGELSRITDELLITVENEGTEGNERTEENEGKARNEGTEEDEESRRQTRSDAPDVNYVNDDFPLYYRDWNAIFTERGFVEVEARSRKRDTMRVFRSTPLERS